MEEAHDVYIECDDGTFCLLRSMHEAQRIYEYYEREHARQREGVKCCWVVRPSDYEVMLGRPPDGWSVSTPVRVIISGATIHHQLEPAIRA